jgi:pilus assembly protein Flp/PilA
MIQKIKNFLKDDEGASLVEYGLLVALIAVACIAILGTLGTQLSAMFTRVEGHVATAAS